MNDWELNSCKSSLSCFAFQFHSHCVKEEAIAKSFFDACHSFKFFSASLLFLVCIILSLPPSANSNIGNHATYFLRYKKLIAVPKGHQTQEIFRLALHLFIITLNFICYKMKVRQCYLINIMYKWLCNLQLFLMYTIRKKIRNAFMLRNNVSKWVIQKNSSYAC